MQIIGLLAGHEDRDSDGLLPEADEENNSLAELLTRENLATLLQ